MDDEGLDNPTEPTRSYAGTGRHLQVVRDGEPLHPKARPLSEDVAPWERQPGERQNQWRAFKHYRDSSVERSLRKTAAETDTRFSSVTNWSRIWQWRRRAYEYDLELDRQATRDAIEEKRRMAVRHAQQAQLFMTALSQPAISLMRKIQQDPTFFDRMLKSAEDRNGNLNVGKTLELMQRLERFARAFPQVAAVERLARGEPTSITQNDDTVNVRDSDGNVAQAIYDDPEIAQAASELFARIESRLG